jgi:hypothetical protein
MLFDFLFGTKPVLFRDSNRTYALLPILVCHEGSSKHSPGGLSFHTSRTSIRAGVAMLRVVLSDSNARLAADRVLPPIGPLTMSYPGCT